VFGFRAASFRSSAVTSVSTSQSTAFSAKAGAYYAKPRPRRHSAMSKALPV